MSKELLAAINAVLNATSAVLLVSGYLTIRWHQSRASLPSAEAGFPVPDVMTLRSSAQSIRLHAALMLCALTTSAIFLVSYITSYLKYDERSSGLPSGAIKTTYLLMLASHVLLAMGMLPMIGLTLWRAYRREWSKHRRIARPTFWIWLYVSVTGVMIYLVLYQLAPRMGSAG